MGRRRRRKIVRRVRRVLPKVFQCIHCGRRAVSVIIDRRRSVATVMCSNCGARDEVDIEPYMSIVDAYAAWTDRIYRKETAVMER